MTISRRVGCCARVAVRSGSASAVDCPSAAGEPAGVPSRVGCGFTSGVPAGRGPGVCWRAALGLTVTGVPGAGVLSPPRAAATTVRVGVGSVPLTTSLRINARRRPRIHAWRWRASTLPNRRSRHRPPRCRGCHQLTSRSHSSPPEEGSAQEATSQGHQPQHTRPAPPARPQIHPRLDAASPA